MANLSNIIYENASIEIPNASDYSLLSKRSHRWIHNSKITVELKRGYLKQDKANFTPEQYFNFFIVSETDALLRDLNTNLNTN